MSHSERLTCRVKGADDLSAPFGVQSPGRSADGRLVAVSSTQDFSTVYVRWMPSLTRYCRAILRSDADAEDAAQNAMLKAMDALATGPAPDQLTPWLHRIARNEAISLMRRRRGDAELLELHHQAGPAPEEIIGTRDRLAQLVADVQALPERQRQALVLRELDGMPYRQIASALDVTESAAQQAVLDARRSMSECETGRALECESVQGWLNAHEHALVRGRKVRAHLRSCDGCRSFAVGLGTRPRELALLLPLGPSGMGLLARLAAVFAGGGAVAGKVALGAGLLTAGLGLGELVVHPGGSDAARAPLARATTPPRSTSAPSPAAVASQVGVPRRPAAGASSAWGPGSAGPRPRRAGGPGRPVSGPHRAVIPSPPNRGQAVVSGSARPAAGVPSAGDPVTAPSAPTHPSSGAAEPSVAPNTTPPLPAAGPPPTGTPAEPVPSSPVVAPVVAALTPVAEQATAPAAQPVVQTVTDTVGGASAAVGQAGAAVSQAVGGVSSRLPAGG